MIAGAAHRAGMLRGERSCCGVLASGFPQDLLGFICARPCFDPNDDSPLLERAGLFPIGAGFS